jgi:type VI secretion system secreted protein Hcp
MDVILMKMTPDVPGTSTIKDFEGQIELLSFSHGVAMQITGDISNSERTSGKPNHQDFTVTKYLDQSSPRLNQSCCEGSTFKEVVITIGRNDHGNTMPLMDYTLKNVVLSSISIGGGGGDMPVETVTMNYSHIHWNYKGSGKSDASGGWDVARNKAT